MGSYVVDTGNRITNDGTWTYSYDAAETRVKKSKGVNDETWTYEYDLHNHLTRVEQRATDGGTLLLRIDYAYDALGNRIRRTVYDGALSVLDDQKFGLDGWDTTLGGGYVAPSAFAPDNSAFNVWADLDAANDLVTRRLFGISFDETVARISATGTLAYYALDRQNSVNYLLDDAGAVQATIVYDGFGNIASNSNPSYTDTYAFQGKRLESSFNAYDYNDRWLFADVFKFSGPDRLGFAAGDTNLTRPMGNSPVNRSDPSGRAHDAKPLSAVDRYDDNAAARG